VAQRGILADEKSELIKVTLAGFSIGGNFLCFHECVALSCKDLCPHGYAVHAEHVFLYQRCH